MTVSRLVDGKSEISDYSRTFDLTCGVLCVGAGCAGVYAADSAAREGADVILVENDVSVGGMHVLGNVKGYYYGADGGAFEEDDEVCRADGGYHLAGYIQKKQAILLERLRRSGVRLLTEHTPTGVLFEGGRAVGITVFDGEREIAIGAKITVDSTSDGHLIRMCEVRKEYGRETDGKSAPFSVFATYIKDGKCVRINSDAGYLNPYDSRDFSEKAVAAHEAAERYLEDGEFLNLASHTGVREGLRFEGENTLSYEDVLLGKTPERILFYAYSDLDRHGNDHALDEELYQNWFVISNLSTVTVRIPVPLGAIVPKGISGLVTAGRCLSADTYVGGAVRMIRDMFRMGECVGCAAAMAARGDCDLLGIDYAEYERRVRARGCFAGDEKKSFGFAYPKIGMPYTPVTFNAKENLHLLRTETPGVAFWSCFVNGNTETADEILRELSGATDTLYKYNLAIALGIMGDERALPTLREIVKSRDCFYFKDCRRTNQFRSIIAICLLGRLGDESDVPLLWEIAFSDAEFSREMYHTLKPDYLYYKGTDRNFLYFNAFTYAVAALVKIHGRLELPTSELRARLSGLLAGGEILTRIVNGASAGASYDEVENFLIQMIDAVSAH